jgi:RNA polymerase sigma-70 factor (ECF subfamily)
LSATLQAPWLWEVGSVVSNAESETPAQPIWGWVVQLQSGQAEALEPLIQHTQDRGWHIAYSILQNRQEVEDALQDAYLSVYQNIHQLREPKAFWGWFKRILVHRCLHLRQQTPLQVLEEVAIEPEPSEQKLDVQQAFQRLSPADRTVLGLREVLDYPYEQIAQLLQVPLSTVKTRLHNARTRLLKLFIGQPKGGTHS